MATGYDPAAAINLIASHLKGRGSIKNVHIGLPKAPETSEIGAAVRMVGIRTPETVLEAPVRIYEVEVRLYRSAMDDGEETELKLAQVVGDVMAELGGDFTLGGNVRNVDVAGIYGASLEADWDDLESAGTDFRVCNITVPLVVDESAASLSA